MAGQFNLFDIGEAVQQAGATLETNLRKQLSRGYFSRSYEGVVKPVKGGDFGGIAPKNYRSTLRDGINVKVDISRLPTNFNEMDKQIISGALTYIIEFGDASNYWYYVNYGRKPGVPYQKKKQGRSKKTGRFQKNRYWTSYTKMPPLKDIQVWVESKPALTDPTLSVETRTYLAMRSIARDGIYGINFVENAIRETRQDLESASSQFIGSWFAKTINKSGVLAIGKEGPLELRIKL